MFKVLVTTYMLSAHGNEGKAISMVVVEFTTMEEVEVALFNIKKNSQTLPTSMHQNAVFLA